MLITARRGSTLSSSQLIVSWPEARRSVAPSAEQPLHSTQSQRFTARSTLSAQYHGHALLSVTALYSITLCTASRHALHKTRSKLTAPSVPRYDPRRRARHDAQHSEWRRQHGMARSTGSARAARSAHAQYGVARARQHSAQQHAQHAAARGTTLSSGRLSGSTRMAARHGAQARSAQRSACSARHGTRSAARAWHA